MSRMKKRANSNGNFLEAAVLNSVTESSYYLKLKEISMSIFEWKDMPVSVDTRFLEQTLFDTSNALFFLDEEMGEYYTLKCTLTGRPDIYNIPVIRSGYSDNGYRIVRDRTNSVIIWSNYTHTPYTNPILLYAQRLWNLDRIVDVNCNSQKTPVLLSADETERLTLINVYNDWDGNKPVIHGTKSLNPDAIKSLRTDAPFVSDKIYDIKSKIWNEALTFIGVPNMEATKRERMLKDEVQRMMGGTLASRLGAILARKQAADEINRMFGLSVSVDYRPEVTVDLAMPNTENDVYYTQGGT